MAISYVPAASGKYFMIQPTRGIGRPPFGFAVDVPDQIYPHRILKPLEVSDRPIQNFLFTDGGPTPGPNSDVLETTLLSNDVEKIEELCAEYKKHLVVLRLVKRDR